MKIKFHPPLHKKICHRFHCGIRRGGFLQIDLVVALAILAIAILPLGFSFERERHLLRIEYFHAAANEIVDGEMEILVAAGAKNLPDGSQIYPVHSRAADNLPPGHFQLTKNGNHLRLEWLPDVKHGYHPVVREITLK
ncbi:MAG TPA: hypothetical protein VHG89_01785 [Verrucomicrobiae bacterium]|nr:hypothetical protein [Verrucomicrobiae bacterium]